MPENPSRMPGIKSGLQQKAMTSYPSFRSLSTSMENYKKLGYRKSPMELGYPLYSELEFSDITSFHDEHVKGKPVIITIYGDKRRIDMKALEKYGKVEELKKGDVIVF
jgi:zinc protease